ncbi:MAG: T9SS type A sorting domain-containing protein [Flavobacteriales bacterium]
MNKSLLTAFAFISATFAASAQCNPASYDWGTATYGVSPNPTLGETFNDGYIGVPYQDEVYVLCPSNIQDIDPTFLLPVDIDSVSLNGISIFNGINYAPIEIIGLQVNCNNNGDSPNPCNFMPGNAYCGDITGTPNAAGTFPVKINVTAFITVFGTQAIDTAFTGYTLVVNGPQFVENQTATISGMTWMPNPSNESTTLRLGSAVNDRVELTLVNTMGQVIRQSAYNVWKGENNIEVSTSELPNGIYTYLLRSGSDVMSGKLSVQH